MTLSPNMRFASAFLLALALCAGVLAVLNDGPAVSGQRSLLGACPDSRITEARTLLLGTSRSRFGFGPDVREVLGPTTNRARALSSFETMRAILAGWDGKAGDRVVIETSFGIERRNGLEHLAARSGPTDELISRLDIGPTVRDLLGLEDRESEKSDCDGFPVNPRAPADAEDFSNRERFAQRELKFVSTPDQTSAIKGLEALVQDALERGLRVELFIPPMPVCYAEGYRRHGLGGTMDEWTRAVAKASGLRARSGRGPAVTAWDFSGYSPVTLELPPTDNALWRSRYFSDQSHFLRGVGKRIMGRIAGMPDPEGDLGERIDPATVEHHLAVRGAARLKYLRETPAAAAGCIESAGAAPGR